MNTNETLQHAVTIAVSKLAAFRFHRIIGEATMEDVEARVEDVFRFAAIVDNVFKAIGDNTHSEFGADQKDVDKYFTNVVREAVEGNATFVIADAMQARMNMDRDAHAEMHAEMRRGQHE